MLNIKIASDKKRVIMVSGIVCVLLIGVIAFSMSQGNNGKAELGTKANDSKEVIESRKEKKVDKSILAVSMDQVIEFEEGSSEGKLNIENMPENNYDIEVEIQDEKRQTLYKSERIEPGMIIREDKLSKYLKKGNYLCSAIFKAFDKDGKEVKTASANIQITVKK